MHQKSKAALHNSQNYRQHAFNKQQQRKAAVRAPHLELAGRRVADLHRGLAVVRSPEVVEVLRPEGKKAAAWVNQLEQQVHE